MRQYITGRGESHERIILDIIRNSSETGLFPHQLELELAKKKITLTRQGIHKVCSRLMKGELVYKKDGKYFGTNFELGTMMDFAAQLGQAGRTIIDPDLIEPTDDIRIFMENGEAPYHSLCKNVLGISASPKYCEAKFSSKDISEKCLFEFANRVGALVTYIFIETMRPALAQYSQDSIPEKARNTLIPSMIERAVNLEQLYIGFCMLFNKNGTIDKIHNEHHESYFQLDDAHFAKLVSAFKNMYPGIFKAFEELWPGSRIQHTKITKRIAANTQCKHNWYRIHIYKVGIVYRCRLCDLYSDSPVAGRKFEPKKRKDAVSQNIRSRG